MVFTKSFHLLFFFNQAFSYSRLLVVQVWTSIWAAFVVQWAVISWEKERRYAHKNTVMRRVLQNHCLGSAKASVCVLRKGPAVSHLSGVKPSKLSWLEADALTTNPHSAHLPASSPHHTSHNILLTHQAVLARWISYPLCGPSPAQAWSARHGLGHTVRLQRGSDQMDLISVSFQENHLPASASHVL